MAKAKALKGEEDGVSYDVYVCGYFVDTYDHFPNDDEIYADPGTKVEVYKVTRSLVRRGRANAVVWE